MKYRFSLRDTVWITPITIVGIAWGWTALSSLIYLWLMHYDWGSFTFPFNQWWIAAPFVLHPAVLGLDQIQAIFDLAVSAIFASLLVMTVLVFTGRKMWRRWRRIQKQPALYGTTDFATPEQMQQNRFGVKRTPFGG